MMELWVPWSKLQMNTEGDGPETCDFTVYRKYDVTTSHEGGQNHVLMINWVLIDWIECYLLIKIRFYCVTLLQKHINDRHNWLFKG